MREGGREGRGWGGGGGRGGGGGEEKEKEKKKKKKRKCSKLLKAQMKLFMELKFSSFCRKEAQIFSSISKESLLVLMNIPNGVHGGHTYFA
jgi:hypothetical protein